MDITIAEQLDLLLCGEEIYSFKNGEVSCVNYKFLKKLQEDHDIKDIIKACDVYVGRKEKDNIHGPGYLWLSEIEMLQPSNVIREDILCNLASSFFNNKDYVIKNFGRIVDYFFFVLNSLEDDEKLAALEGGKKLELQKVRSARYISDIAMLIGSRHNSIHLLANQNEQFLTHITSFINKSPQTAMTFISRLPDYKVKDIYNSNIENNLVGSSKDVYIKSKSLYLINHFFSDSKNKKDLSIHIIQTLNKISNFDDLSFNKDLNLLYLRQVDYFVLHCNERRNIIKDLFSLQKTIENKASSPQLVTLCRLNPRFLASMTLLPFKDKGFNIKLDFFKDIIETYSKEERGDFLSHILSELFKNLDKTDFDKSIYLIQDILKLPSLDRQVKLSTKFKFNHDIALLVLAITKSGNAIKKNIKSASVRQLFNFLSDTLSPKHKVFGPLQALVLAFDLDDKFKFNQTSLCVPAHFLTILKRKSAFSPTLKSFIQYAHMLDSKYVITKGLEDIKNSKKTTSNKRKI